MTEDIVFQKIVVPLDGSKWAEKAIPHAEQIARGGGELLLLHIYKPAGAEFIGDSALAGQTSHLDEAHRRAEDYCKSLRSRISSQNIKVSAHVVEGNDFAQMVCNFVTAEGADVVVMPAASHSRLARALMGDLSSSISGCVNACLLLVRGGVEAEWHEESKQALETQGQAAVPSSHNSALLLQQLESLHDAGLLSAEEFAAKQAVLETM